MTERPDSPYRAGEDAPPMCIYDFVLTGRIKPYVRMTRRGKWVRPEAREYLTSKAALSLQLKSQMQGREILPRTPLAVNIIFEFPKECGFHHMDTDNLIKAVLDSANSIVYSDDRWIDIIGAERRHGKEHKIYLEVWQLKGR